MMKEQQQVYPWPVRLVGWLGWQVITPVAVGWAVGILMFGWLGGAG